MGYFMKMKDIDAMYDQYLAYGDQNAGTLASALSSVRSAVETFQHMDSFKGEAADALKGYLTDMHTVFSQELLTLCALLQTEYAVKYMQRYADSPIRERGDAALPEDELEQKRSLLAQAKDARIPQIDDELSAVAQLLPAGAWPAIPTAGNLQNAFAAAHDDIEQLKNEVRRVEEEGLRLFEDGGLLSQHIACLKRAIQQTACDATAVASYEAGSYFMSDSAFELSEVGRRAAAEVAASKDALIAAQDQMLERQILREEETYRLMEEGRSQWELVGIGASVIGTLAAATAILGTGGAAAIVAGAGALQSALGTVTRIQDYASGKNSAWGLETDSSSATLKSAITSSATSTAASALSKLTKGKSATTVLTGNAKSAVSFTGKASQAVTVLADQNQDRMREEARAHLRRIEDLRSRHSPRAA